MARVRFGYPEPLATATLEEQHVELDRMSLEELASLEEILTAIDLGLRLRDPAVWQVLGRSEAFLHRAEALAAEVVGGP